MSQPLSGVSVVICCYNSAARLTPTLTHLATQKVPTGLPWEVIVIDNASTDGTGEAAARLWPKDASIPLRVVQESRPGLSNARQRGFDEARYDVVSFVDDDNWVTPDWVERVDAVFRTHPEVGVCGSCSFPVYEVPAPPWFNKFHGHLAIGSQARETGDITNTRGLVWGAGMSVRKQAWIDLRQRGFQFWMADRTGSSLVAGGDCELCFGLRLAGWRIWYDSELQLSHFMPTGRLTWDYLLRLAEGSGRTDAWADGYHNILSENPRNMGYGHWCKIVLRTALRYARVSIVNRLSPAKTRIGGIRAFNCVLYRARLEVLIRSRRQLMQQWATLFATYHGKSPPESGKTPDPHS